MHLLLIVPMQGMSQFVIGLGDSNTAYIHTKQSMPCNIDHLSAYYLIQFVFVEFVRQAALVDLCLA